MADSKPDDSSSGAAAAAPATDKPEVATTTTSMPALTDAERDLAHQSTHEFEKGNFDACSRLLHKLNETRSQDSRVILNMAVVDYYKSSFTKTKEFKAAIAEVSEKASY